MKLILLIITLAEIVPRDVNALGGGYWLCNSTTSVDVYNQKYGTVVSDNYPNAYNPNMNCNFDLTLPNPAYQYVSLKVEEWIFDMSAWDRITISVSTVVGGTLKTVANLYAANSTWFATFRTPGSVRITWYTDAGWGAGWSGTPKWKLSFTYQKYVFGCEVSPQPYFYPNTTRHGVIKSPFFPDHYPVNSYCQTYIDIDQSIDLIEFVPIMFELRGGDALLFYVGDIRLNNWVQFANFTTKPSTFRIYGADVKILFVSDLVACSYGYQFYWRVISKERYPIYKPQSLVGFWPLTAAHRGVDIMQGCNAVLYPTAGQITPINGPFGNTAGGLYFQNAYLNMTSNRCVQTLQFNGSLTLSVFAQTSTYSPIIQFNKQSGPDASMTQIFTNYPSSGDVHCTMSSKTTLMNYASDAYGSAIKTAFSYITMLQDSKVGSMRVYQNNYLKNTANTEVNLIPAPSNGFLFGYRDNSLVAGGVAQTGRFSCLSMYSEALSPTDMAQVGVMCQKVQQQYEIYSGNSLYAWWPMTSTSGGLMKDISGNGRDGSIVSTTDITLTSGPTGAPNSAYLFNGNSNIFIPTAAFKSFTISFYATVSAGNCDWITLYPTNASYNTGVKIYQNGGPSTIDQIVINPSGILNDATHNIPSGINFSQWRFVSAVYDARSGSMSIWIDGTQANAWTIGVDYAVATSDTRGGYVGGAPGSALFQGQMSCLSIYKTALTASQIAKVKAACDNGYFQVPALVELMGFWPLTNLTGTQDISGYELTATFMSSGVVPTTGPFGIPNTAYALGADATSYINFNAGAGTNLGTGSWSISFFVKLLTPNFQPLLEYVTAGNNAGFHIWGQNGSLFFNNLAQNAYIAGFNFNQWQFVSAVFDANSKTFSLWRDGAKLGSWAGEVSVASNYGFNLGYRVIDGSFAKMHVSCLSIYRSALDADGIGRVLSMCQSYLMDQALRDQTRLPETSCNFDGGFCGWNQDVNDDTNWQLGHDATPTGTPYVFTTGPRFGKSVERIDALDQYAFLNSALTTPNGHARLMSPVLTPGWHCFSFWYYMAGGNVNTLTVATAWGAQQFFSRQNSQGKQWNYFATSFFLPGQDFLIVDGSAGSLNKYSDIAIDDIRISDSKCASSTPCPRGWLDFGRKCYLPFVSSALSKADASAFCSRRLKARLALPENPQELSYVQSQIGGSAIWIDGQKSGSWVNSNNIPLTYLPWINTEPGTSDIMATLTSAGFVGVLSGTNGFICEVTKLEAQHLGFNCSFDNKHMCGWWNADGASNPADTNEPSQLGTASADVDIWSGLSLPWQSEDNENGPEWDWNQGNNRGYYVMLEDGAVPTCTSVKVDLHSPVVKSTGKAQCLRFRHFRSTYVNAIEIYVQSISNGVVLSSGSPWTLNGSTSPNWRTFEIEINQTTDYEVIIRLWMSCTSGGFGNQVIDDIQLFDSTCAIPLFAWTWAGSTNSYRLQPGWVDAIDTVGDANFYNSNDGYCAWRDLPGDDGNWTSSSFVYATGFRRSGPQSDYTGEGNYLNLDLKNGSLNAQARFSGPPIASGQKCFIFHYFAYGYDVGELRLVDGKGRYLFAVQQSQSPSWKEHRILFSSTTPTNVIFEGSGGQNDGLTHFQQFQSLQIDDIYTRNGTDLCLGFFDCDFDRSSYLSDCGWVQNDTDDADWVRNSGETPAGNGLTGPTADQTTGLGHYLYFDSTNLQPGSKARIHTPPVAAGNFCLTFYYFMYGQDIGGLRAFYVPQSNMLLSKSGTFPPYTEQTLWSKNGSQGNLWRRAMVPLQLSYPQILTFEALRGNGDRGDVAIDDVVLLKGDCPNERSFSCSFERGDTCTWYNDWTAQQKFSINKGKTKGAPMTGPEGDATGAYAGGYYAYLSSITGSPGDAARLNSPLLPAGTVCLQLSYNMRGRQLGQLNVYRNSDRLIRLRGGSTGYEWRRVVSTIQSNVSFSIKIEAVRGASSLGDIAIDDIVISNGPCGSIATVQSTMGAYASKGASSLAGHTINAGPVTNASLSSCVAQCLTTPGCLSVNFDSSCSLCQLNNATAEMDPFNLVSSSSTTSYIALTSPFRQLDLRLQNLCTLDSPTCTVTPNCSTLLGSSMLVCQCVEPGRSCYMPVDCSNAFDNGYVASGAYLIQPNATAKAIATWCDMDVVNQKGYTVLVNRFNGGTRFNGRTLDEYRNFFGSVNGEFWIGLEAMNQLTSQFDYGYAIEGSLFGINYSPIGSPSSTPPFKVDSSANNYRMTLEPIGSMTSSMNNAPFSTIDRDLTGSVVCPSGFAGSGWWYASSCHSGMLTGPYRPNEQLSSGTFGMFSADMGGSLGLSAMRLKISRLSQSSPSVTVTGSANIADVTTGGSSA